jgi:hypothetical protein
MRRTAAVGIGRWMGVAATVLTAACGGGGGGLVQLQSGAGGASQLTVGSGTTPTYSWTGGAARSLVVQSGSGEVFFQLEALDLNSGFTGPVAHGATPTGSRIVTAGRTLTPGAVHTATVTTVGGTTATRTFTPASLTSP